MRRRPNCPSQLPLRFGNWNNTSNAGLWYRNGNNPRSNSNNNISGRPALPPSETNFSPSSVGQGLQDGKGGKGDSKAGGGVITRRHAILRIMDKIKNIYKDIASFENLYRASLQAQKDKRYRDNVLDYNRHREENLINTQNSLLWHTYELLPYHERYVYEPKKRLIMIQQYPDRVVQWAAYRKIMPIIDKTFYDYSFACRKGKGSYASIETLQGWLQAVYGLGYYYGIDDISKFFMRVDHEVMMWDLRNRVEDEEVIWLYDKFYNSSDTAFGIPEGLSADQVAIEDRLFNVGMPIGNLSSQGEGNMYLDNLDRFFVNDLGFNESHILDKAAKLKRSGTHDNIEDAKILVEMCNGGMMRYMDDSLIIGPSKREIWRALDDARQYANDVLHLRFNDKTRVGRCDDGIDWLGCYVMADGIRIKRQSRNRIIKKLNARRKAYKAGKISAEKLEATENSYRARLEKLGCIGLLHDLGLEDNMNEHH